MGLYEGDLTRVIALLQREGRVTYWALHHEFGFDEAFLEGLRCELIFKGIARDEEGLGLVWTGSATAVVQPTLAGPPVRPLLSTLPPLVVGPATRSPRSTPAPSVIAPRRQGGEPLAPAPTGPAVSPDGVPALPPHGDTSPAATASPSDAMPAAPSAPVVDDARAPDPVALPASQEPVERASASHGATGDTATVRPTPDAERRQLTVLFCDLVGSTDLSGRLDPEDLREVVRAYQETAAVVIQQYEGHIAQYLGDGLLVYFGYPLAHEDDALRAVYTGLGIVEAMATLNTRLEAEYGVQLAVRLGIHTGPVVVGQMGGGGRHEQLALGETPNIAARLEGLAAPNTVVISPVTARLVAATCVLESLGPQTLKGIADPLEVWRVAGLRDLYQESLAPATPGDGAGLLVGRDEEIGLLRRRWAQSKEGLGQVVLITGEAGIGKSSLVQVLRAQVAQDGRPCITFRCSPYHTNSALYPVITHLHHFLQVERDDAPNVKLAKLERGLAPYALPVAEMVPLLAALLAVPLPEGRYPALAVSPQQQRQQTLEALNAWLLAEAERQPTLVLWEDLHWADPTTLELLGLLVEQVPTAALLSVLTFRPEFVPSWPTRSHLTPLTLNRLERPQVEALITRLARGKRLPPEAITSIVTRADGVPLYVEELTKALLESGLLQEQADQYQLTGPLSAVAIPTTLQDSLMARLDRLPTGREVAELGAVLGREFAYEMLRALGVVEEARLQEGLAQLVNAELLYQRGRPPRARYIFKHALVQDAAYQSILRRTRQHYHRQVAELIETRFADLVETEPELVAHHYTEAGCPEQAIPYWQRAGQYASARSANLEAVSHFTTGIELLQTLPETPAHTQHALTLHLALGAALQMAKGHAAPEVEHAYTQARALCQQVGETPELAPVLFGLWRFYIARPELHTARELGETLLRLAQRAPDPALAVVAHYALGLTWSYLGALPAARPHLEEGSARYTPDQRRALAFRTGQDPGVPCRFHAARTLWLLGYPDQALARLHDGLALARALSHPYTLGSAWCYAAIVSQYRRDVPAVHEHAEAAVALSTEQGFPLWAAQGTSLRGWALAMQGQGEEGLAQIRQGIAAWRATGAALAVPYFCTLLADVAAHLGYTEDGLQALAEAHTLVEQYEERWGEAEIYRLQGVLLLRQPETPPAEAEAWLQRALDVARRQEAKSLELRAAISLSRLWHRQGQREEAHALLAPVYEWFTEGFDTADLQEAKALLEELA